MDTDKSLKVAQGLLVLLVVLLSGSPVLMDRALAQGFSVTAENMPAFRKIPEIENQLYGHTYMNQSVGQRISRLERTLFGASHRGPLEIRMAQIEQQVAEKNVQKTLADQSPLIEYLEEKLFQRTFPNQPLVERVRRLEVQVFGHSFDSYPVSVRIKKLTYAMPLMAKEVRLTKAAPEGEMVVATTHRISRLAPREAPKVDMVQLDATNSIASRAVSSGTPLSIGDYSQSVYREPDGNTMRWLALPIKVFIKAEGPEYGLSLQALKAWQGSFSVQLVERSSAADVIVTWDKATWDQNTTGLLTRPVVQVDDKHSIRTVILISLFPVSGQAQANQLHVLSHQLGHAFGLWGHSEDPADIMYPALKPEFNDFPGKWAWRSAKLNQKLQPSGLAEDYVPTQRDINTLLRIYDQPATDLSNYSPY